MSGFGRQLHNAADDEPLNMRIRASLDGTLDELPNTFEFWSKEDAKEAIEGLQRADQAQQSRAVSIENGEAFLEGHKEFVKTDANIKLMNHELKSKFGVRAYSVDDYELAYESLRSSNFLELDKNVLAAQEKQTAKQRYEQAKARGAMPSQEELDRMPIEEIEARARGWK